MNPNQIAAFKALEQAQQALKSGNKDAARQFSEEAVQLAPELEEVWLLKAALSSPRDSLVYLEQALKINPNSERAKKGMRWAQGRLQDELYQRPEAELPPAESGTISSPETASTPGRILPAEAPTVSEPARLSDTAPTQVGAIAAESADQVKPASARPRFSFVSLLVVLVLLILAWAAWQGVTPAAAFLSRSFTVREHGPAWASADISKSDNTQTGPVSTPTVVLEPTSEPTLVSPTPEDASLPSPTPAPIVVIPVATDTPLPTSISNPTANPTATPPVTSPDISVSPTPLPTDTSFPMGNTPIPTDVITQPTATLAVLTSTPVPTEVAQATATPEISSNELASPTPLPTDTAAPFPTQFVPPTRSPGTGGNTGGGDRWIDVDLTHQMVYAYEGNTVVNSFLVSTGTWQYPTVTGQYHIYIKLRYKDMSGPGYYLPNVPYTMFFYEGYAIHGTYWHNNFGTPMSHGCVNLSIPDSEWMFNFASVGTLVNVHY